MAVNSAVQLVRNARAIAQTLAAIEVDYLVSTFVIEPDDRAEELIARTPGYVSAVTTLLTHVNGKFDSHVTLPSDANDVYVLFATLVRQNAAFAGYGDGTSTGLSNSFDFANLNVTSTMLADLLAAYATEEKGRQVVNVGGTADTLVPTGLVATSGSQVVNVGGAKVSTDSTGLTANTAGYQIINVGGAHVGSDATSLVSGTTYTATITVDGAAKAISIVGSAAATFATLINELNTDLGSAAVASLTAGNIKITSATTGSASSVAITAGTLFAAPLAGFASVTSAVAGTSTTYTATITIDGTAHAVSIVGGVAQTFATLINEINKDIVPFGTAALVGGNISITSATTGSASSVAITAGTLFAAPLAGFASVSSAVAGAATTYTASVVVDGGSSQPISVIGSNARTFGQLINEIQADITGATAALVDGNICITSNSQGAASTVVITPGTLFAAPLAGFVSVSPAVNGNTNYTRTVVLTEGILLSNGSLQKTPLANAILP